MERKTQKKYIYDGLGFPIELYNVEFVKVRGEWVAKIDVRNIALKAMRDLAFQDTRLTGNQVRFIREYFQMSLRQFAKVVHQSHTAIDKWEKFGNKATNMDSNIEVVLRLHIYHEVCTKTLKQKSNFYKAYEKISSIDLSKQHMASA
jgi:DNA-binding transcriptional regulator YiaG